MRREFRPPALSPLPNREKANLGTWVAYANPSSTEALVIFSARDADGQVLASVNQELAAVPRTAEDPPETPGKDTDRAE